jgi:hypothetical protein
LTDETKAMLRGEPGTENVRANVYARDDDDDEDLPEALCDELERLEAEAAQKLRVVSA